VCGFPISNFMKKKALPLFLHDLKRFFIRFGFA